MLTMNDVVKEGATILRERAETIALPPSEEDRAILKKMQDFLVNSQDPEISAKYNLRPGIGIAAPQIGVSKRMIAILVEDEEGQLYDYALFNPRIMSHSVQKSYLEGGEGCLSVDRDVPGFVPRYYKVKVKATTLEGEEIELKLKGLSSIVFQHEIDHLNGIMFYDHINKEDPFDRPDGISIGR